MTQKMYNSAIEIFRRKFKSKDISEKRIYNIIGNGFIDSEEEVNQKIQVTYEVLNKIEDIISTFLTDKEILSLYILSYMADEFQESRYKLYGLDRHVPCLSVEFVCESFGISKKDFDKSIAIAYPYYLSLLRSVIYD